jgi:hypothetical protein
MNSVVIYDKTDYISRDIFERNFSFMSPFEINLFDITMFGFNEFSNLIKKNEESEKPFIFLFVNFSTFNKFCEKLQSMEFKIFLDERNINFTSIKYVIWSLEEFYSDKDITLFKNYLEKEYIDYYILPSEQAFLNLADKAYQSEIGWKDKVYISHLGSNFSLTRDNFVETKFLIPVPTSMLGIFESIYNIRELSEMTNETDFKFSFANKPSQEFAKFVNENLMESSMNLNLINSLKDFVINDGDVVRINAIPKDAYIFPFLNCKYNYIYDFYQYIYNANIPYFSIQSGCLKEQTLNKNFLLKDLNELAEVVKKFNQLEGLGTARLINLTEREKLKILLSWKFVFMNIENFLNFQITGKISDEAIKQDFAIFKLFDRHYGNYTPYLYDLINNESN